jgi:hypothetical protein
VLLESPLVFDIVFEPIVALPVDETYITLLSESLDDRSEDIVSDDVTDWVADIEV